MISSMLEGAAIPDALAPTPPTPPTEEHAPPIANVVPPIIEVQPTPVATVTVIEQPLTDDQKRMQADFEQVVSVENEGGYSADATYYYNSIPRDDEGALRRAHKKGYQFDPTYTPTPGVRSMIRLRILRTIKDAMDKAVANRIDTQRPTVHGAEEVKVDDMDMASTKANGYTSAESILNKLPQYATDNDES